MASVLFLAAGSAVPLHHTRSAHVSGSAEFIKGCRENEHNKHILAQNFLIFPIVCMEQFLSTSSGLLLLIHL